MSHSQKAADPSKELKMIKKDLKKNYSKKDLITLARYYGISTHLSKERLITEVAKANLESTSKKATLESGIELKTFTPTTSNVHLNRQVLTETQQRCISGMKDIQKRMSERLEELHKKYVELYETLERGLEIDPRVFNDILPEILGDCTGDLEEIVNFFTNTIDNIDKSTTEKVRRLSGLLQEMKTQPAPVAKPVVAIVGPVAKPEPKPAPKPASKPAPKPVPGLGDEIVTINVADVVTDDTSDELASILRDGVTEIVCGTDEDCDRLAKSGQLSDTLRGQRVICVTKRDGTSACAYEA